MSHVKRRPSPKRKTTITRRQKKRKTYGLILITVLFISIALSILFIALSMP